MNAPLRLSLLAAVLAASLSSLHAEEAPPLDQAYPGQLSLAVDLSRAPTKIYQVRESIPVQPGALTLYYPKWIPGEHAPSGPVQNVAGLMITGNGQKIAWRRDLRDMYSLHLQIPAGVQTIELAFQFLAPGEEGGLFGAGASATPKLVDVEFNQVAFYPAGYYSRQVQIQPSVTLPAGWQFGSALEVQGRSGDTVNFKPVSFDNLVDAPLIAGEYFKRVDLDPKGAVPMHLDVVGDSADNLRISDKQIAQHQALVSQANKLFGAHHYQHYDFLLTLSEHTDHFGLEHHQSSDNRLPSNFFTDDQLYLRAADLMPHEFVHSWNGKFRRPADLWTANFNTPMQDDLLWVYEGLTEYFGEVLTARAGLWTPQEYRDSLALTAAQMTYRTGRQWRTLQDTADAAPLTYYGGGGWANWSRGTDFYPEGALLWLDVDTQIRKLSDGKRSLDDFARAFYGMDNGSYVTRTYDFDDVVQELNQVQAYDWAKFLRDRLDYSGDQLPEHGIERGGWKLVFDETPSALDKAESSLHPRLNLAYSLGLSIGANGRIGDVQWGGPAFAAGLVPGLKVIAVNGKDYSISAIKDAVTAAKSGTAPIALLVQNDEYFSTVKIDYHGGLRYPHLVRADGEPDRIGAIAAPRK